MDNSPRVKTKAGKMEVTQCPPFRSPGDLHYELMEVTQRPNGGHRVTSRGEHRSVLRATWKNITQRKSLPKVRARALPSLWITR